MTRYVGLSGEMEKPTSLSGDILCQPCSLWPSCLLACKGNRPSLIAARCTWYCICQLMFSNKGSLFLLIIWTFCICVYLHIQTRATLFWVNSPISLRPHWGRGRGSASKRPGRKQWAQAAIQQHWRDLQEEASSD